MGRRAQAAFVFLFITVLLDMLAFGMAIPVLPRLVAEPATAVREAT